LVLELLRGETLGERIARVGRLPPSEAAGILDDVLGVLAAAHANGLVHRDVKPDNVFLTEDGRIKLLDFGVAAWRGPYDRGQTIAGTVFGTPAFMPPEQASGRWEEVDERSDVWAAGATLFMMLTGRYLRDADSAAEELAAALQPLPRIAALAPEMPQALARLLDRALAHAPRDRFASAAGMQSALRELRSPGTHGSNNAVPLEVVPGRVPFRRRRRRGALLAVALAAAVGAVTVAVAWAGSRPPALAGVHALPPLPVSLTSDVADPAPMPSVSLLPPVSPTRPEPRASVWTAPRPPISPLRHASDRHVDGAHGRDPLDGRF
jgi:serine/threonine protein kinase